MSDVCTVIKGIDYNGGKNSQKKMPSKLKLKFQNRIIFLYMVDDFTALSFNDAERNLKNCSNIWFFVIHIFEFYSQNDLSYSLLLKRHYQE